MAMKHRTQFMWYSFWNKHKSVKRCSGKAFYDMKGRTNAHVAFCFLSGIQSCGGHLVMKGWPANDRGWGVIHTIPVLLMTVLSVFSTYELPNLRILSFFPCSEWNQGLKYVDQALYHCAASTALGFWRHNIVTYPGTHDSFSFQSLE